MGNHDTLYRDLENVNKTLHELDDLKQQFESAKESALQYAAAITSPNQLSHLPNGKGWIVAGVLAALAFASGVSLLLRQAVMHRAKDIWQYVGLFLFLLGFAAILFLIILIRKKSRVFATDAHQKLEQMQIFLHAHQMELTLIPEDLWNGNASDYLLQCIHANPGIALNVAVAQCRRVPGMSREASTLHAAVSRF